MTYNKVKIGPLIMFLGFLIGMFLVMFVGVNEVFALNTNSAYVKIFDNYGTSLTEITTNKVTSPKTYWTANIPTIVSNSYGGAIIIQTETPLAKNVNYSISINLTICKSDGSACYNPAISSKFNLGIGTGIQLTKDSYFDNTAAEVITKEVTGNYVYYNFTTKTNGSYILIPFTSITSCSGGCIVDYYGYDLVSNGLASDLTQQEITNITTNQTNELNQSIQNSTDTITGEIDDMEQSIIDSNEENTDKIIEANKVCKDYNYTYDNIQKYDGYLGSSNAIIDGGISYKHTDYIPLNKNENYNLTINFTNNNLNYCTYKKDKTLISCQKYNSQSFTINLSEDGYIRYSTRLNYEVNFNGKYCENGNQAVSDNLNDIKDALTDSSPTDMTGLGNSAGWLPPGPVDSILNLPLTFFLNLSESLSSECRPVELTLPFVNKKIYLPCIRSLYDKMGVTGTIFTTAGVIASAVMLYNYLLALYKWVDDTLTLRENTMPGYYEDKWGGGA